MGLDLTLFMADWKHLGAIPVERRVEALEDMAWPPELDDEYLRYGSAGGWIRPPDRGSAWCAEYGFFTTTGAYSPHSRAGDAWDDMRLLVAASVRGDTDNLLDGLIWDADPARDPVRTGGGGFFPPADGRASFSCARPRRSPARRMPGSA